MQGRAAGTEALPHREFWLELKSLVTDGCTSVAARVKQLATETPMPAAREEGLLGSQPPKAPGSQPPKADGGGGGSGSSSDSDGGLVE